RAVNVDVAAHRVDLAETIAADLRARQPQDTRQDPVAAGVRRGKLGRPDLAGRPAAAKDRAERRARADVRAHDVPAAGRAVAAAPLPRAVPGRRHAIDLRRAAVLDERHPLRREVDRELHAHALRSSASHSAYGCPTRLTL